MSFFHDSCSRRFIILIMASGLVVSGVSLAATTTTKNTQKVTTPAAAAPAVLTEEAKFVSLLQRSLPSVVSIVASRPGIAGQTATVSRGTGFVVDPNGLILTNKHVVAMTDTKYRAYFPDGRRYEATVVGRDPLQDLALVKINGDKLPTLKLGDSDAIQIGQTAIAIGNSLGRYPNTVTRGIISGIGRSITAGDDLTGQIESLDNVIQTDAQINLGNSGGPLLNGQGEVVGINTAIEQAGRGVGFALPINDAKKVINTYKKSGRIVRPYLGLRYVTVSADIMDDKKLAYDYGALINAGDGSNGPAIISNGPADKAGLQADDIILSINDQLIRGGRTLYTMVQKYNVGDTLKLQVYRRGGLMQILVTLEEVPAFKSGN